MCICIPDRFCSKKCKRYCWYAFLELLLLTGLTTAEVMIVLYSPDDRTALLVILIIITGCMLQLGIFLVNETPDPMVIRERETTQRPPRDRNSVNTPTSINGMKGKCFVCAEEVNGKDIMYINDCKHLFHYTCFTDLVSTIKKAMPFPDDTCPQCDKKYLNWQSNSPTDNKTSSVVIPMQTPGVDEVSL